MDGAPGLCPLQLADKLAYAQPDNLALLVANLPHVVGPFHGFRSSLFTVAVDQHIGGTPDVDIIGHSAIPNPSITEAG